MRLTGHGPNGPRARHRQADGPAHKSPHQLAHTAHLPYTVYTPHGPRARRPGPRHSILSQSADRAVPNADALAMARFAIFLNFLPFAMSSVTYAYFALAVFICVFVFTFLYSVYPYLTRSKVPMIRTPFSKKDVMKTVLVLGSGNFLQSRWCDIPTCRAHSGDHNALWSTPSECASTATMARRWQQAAGMRYGQ